jgi:hypothetical protein
LVSLLVGSFVFFSRKLLSPSPSRIFVIGSFSCNTDVSKEAFLENVGNIESLTCEAPFSVSLAKGTVIDRIGLDEVSSNFADTEEDGVLEPSGGKMVKLEKTELKDPFKN